MIIPIWLVEFGYAVLRSNYSAYFTQVVEDIQAYLAGRPIRILASLR